LPGKTSGLEERVAVSELAGSALRLTERDRQRAGLPVRGFTGRVSQLEGLPVVVGRFVVGQLEQCPIAGPGGVVDGLGGVPGGGDSGPVVGEGGEMVFQGAGMDGLDGVGDPAMEGGSTGARKVAVDGVAGQGVGEPVAVGGVGHLDQQAGLRCLLGGREDAVLVEAGGGSHDGEVEFGADHSGDAQHPVGGLGEARQPSADHVTDALGNPDVANIETGGPAAAVALDCAGLRQVPQHLPHEEGVALGLLVDGPGQAEVIVVQGVSSRFFHEGGDAGGVEAQEGEPFHVALPAKIGQQFGQRMAVTQVGVPVGAEDEQPPAVP
jgi:hypothetical protein